MNVFKYLREAIVFEIEEISKTGDLPLGLDSSNINVQPPREATYGDAATNAALVLAKQAQLKPREIAELLSPRLLARDEVVAVDIAGPGFVNLHLANGFWHDRLRDMLIAGTEYGISNIGEGRAVNVEYVSANPTGPLHVGHGRGTVFGDVLASLLTQVGYDVTREYYVNDAGAQVDALGRSVHLRYREALGEEIPIDAFEGAYPGEYLVPVGQALAEKYGGRFQESPETEWLAAFRSDAVDAMMDYIRDDLDSLGVRHDVFTSERALVERGLVDSVFAELKASELIYTGLLERPKGKPPPDDWEPRPQSLFRSTRFGDDVDRPLKKSDGSWTYFATDIAYHGDKVSRGFTDMIDVWGSDHGGYVKRMAAAVKAVSGGRAELDVKLCQLVKLLDGGEPVRMSKRSGQFVTLREVVDRVGKDVVRFIMLTRKNDAALEFDLVQVMEQSRDNPVFYVQYAHARVCSVFRNATSEVPAVSAGTAEMIEAPLHQLTHPAELDLIKRLAAWPRVVEAAALAHEPHRLAFYLHDVAADFHLLWNKGKEEPAVRFLVADNPELTQARLALISAVNLVIAAGLRIFGVEPAKEMR